MPMLTKQLSITVDGKRYFFDRRCPTLKLDGVAFPHNACKRWLRALPNNCALLISATNKSLPQQTAALQ